MHSFAKAAAFLGLKQSTLSQHITFVERRLGADLFRRSPRGAVPTEAGAVFLQSAQRVFDEMEGLVEKTRAVSKGRAGTVALGFMTSITAGNLRSSIFAFRDEFQDIKIRGVENARHRLLAMLDAGNLDLLVISGFASHPDTRSMGLWNEQMLVALPKTHALAQRDRIFWSDLHGQTFLAPKSTAEEINAMVQLRLPHAGTTSPVEVTDLSRETVLGAVGAGRAITLVSEAATGMTIDNVIYKPLFDGTGPHVVNFSAYWRTDNRNPTLQTFLGFLRARYSLAPSLD